MVINYEDFGVLGATATLLTEPQDNGEAWALSAAHVFEIRNKDKVDGSFQSHKPTSAKFYLRRTEEDEDIEFEVTISSVNLYP